MKIELTKELKAALSVILKLNPRNFPIYVYDGSLFAQTDIGKVKVPFCEAGLVPENLETAFDNSIIKYITSFDVGKMIEMLPVEKTLKVKSGKCCTSFSVQQNDKIDFPKIEEKNKITVDSSQFCEALMSVSSVCDSSNSATPLTRTIYVRVSGDKMLIEGSDGREMVCFTLNCKATEELIITIPAISAKYVLAIFKSGSENLHIYPHDRSVTIANDLGFRYDLVQVDVSYPHRLLSQAIIPEDDACKATVNIHDLVTSVSRSILLGQGNLVTDFSLTITGNSILIASHGATIKYDDEISATVSKKPDENKTVWFPPGKLFGLLKTFDFSEEVDIFFGSYSRGLIIQEKNAAGCIMPMLQKK